MFLLWRLFRALVAFALVATVVLYASRFRKNAGLIDVTTEIDASADRIWPWLDEGARAKQWVNGLVEVRRTSASPLSVGAKEVWVMSEQGRLMEVTGTCTEYAKPSRLGVHLSAPASFDGDQTYQLTEIGGGRTRLQVTGRFRYAGRMQLMEPFITPTANRAMEVNLGRLKTLIETKPTTSVR